MDERRLYLASSSPRRHELLKLRGIPFEAIPNLLLEEPAYDGRVAIEAYVTELAMQKAVASKSTFLGLVLGADTIVVHEGRVYPKPKDILEAESFLQELSVTTHQVYSSIAVIDTVTGRSVSSVERNDVSFSVLSLAQIRDYCTHYEVLDKAGAYGIQDCGDIFVTGLNGSVESVMGLAVDSLLQILSSYDIV